MYDANSEVVCFCLQGQERIRGQSLGSSEEIWQRLQPVVECGDDAMTLTVRRRRAVQLLLDRGEATASPFTNTPALSGTVTSVYILFFNMNVELYYSVKLHQVSNYHLRIYFQKFSVLK